MQQLLYSSEVRSPKALEIPAVEVKQQELDLAAQLIDSITVDEWHPEDFKDEVQARIQEQIQRKIEGKEVVAPEAPVTASGAQVIDLMEALRASLKQAPAGRKAAKASSPAEATPVAAPVAKRTIKPKKKDSKAA